MEFCERMVVKATIAGSASPGLPSHTFAGGRSRPPHLKSWRDAAASGGSCCSFSPRWPCSFTPVRGTVSHRPSGDDLLLPCPRHVVDEPELDIHTLFDASLGVVVGFHSMLFWVFPRSTACVKDIVPPDAMFVP